LSTSNARAPVAIEERLAILRASMTAEEHSQSLEALAEAFGVTSSYHDGTGRHRHASDDAVLAVVRALGAAVERIEDCPGALRARREEASRPSAPVSVCLAEGQGGDVRFPGALAPRGTTARLHLETGDIVDIRVHADAHGEALVRIPHHTAAGVHRLAIDNGSREHGTAVFIAPARLPEAPKGWALFAPLYGLRDERPGRRRMATYGDLPRLARWMTGGTARSRRHRDSAFLGTLPLLACFLDEPFEPSPYSPVSRAFWSELYVDPSAAPEFGSSPEARRAFEAHGLAADPRPPRIDYRRAMRERRIEIEALREALDRSEGARREAFERRLEEDGELVAYAAFRATVERHGGTWESWPERARGGVLRAGADYDGEAFRYHAYAQWLARQQFAAAAQESPAGFYLDLPLGSHGGGYDTWRHAADHAFGISLGAPPDDVFDGGQDWGFPPLLPSRAQRGDCAALRAALRHHFEHAALLRVDHVMGLHRSFWIPAGFTAADGVYVRSPADELWSLVAIEAARGNGGRGTAVVGEDLGTVPPEVRVEMSARGALRMHVVPFEWGAESEAPLAAPPRDALACLGTHDMESFATWWNSDGCPRERFAGFLRCSDDAEGALAALLEWLAAGDATIALAGLEDLWLEPQRQNLPGTSAGETNWQRPFARSFDDFTNDPAVQRLVDLVRGAASREGEQR